MKFSFISLQSYYINPYVLRYKYKNYSEKNYAFYTCKCSYDYIAYLKEGIYSLKESEYSLSALKKQDGIFNKSKLFNDNDISNVRSYLSAYSGSVYSLIISFDKKDELFANYKSCQYVLNKTIPVLLKENGLQEKDYAYYGALHHNTNKEHIHILIYSKYGQKYTYHNLSQYMKDTCFSKISLHNFLTSTFIMVTSSKFYFLHQKELLNDNKNLNSFSLNLLKLYNSYSNENGLDKYSSLYLSRTKEAYLKTSISTPRKRELLRTIYMFPLTIGEKEFNEVSLNCEIDNLLDEEILEYIKKYKWIKNYKERSIKSIIQTKQTDKKMQRELIIHNHDLYDSLDKKINTLLIQFYQSVKTPLVHNETSNIKSGIERYHS